MTFLTLVRHGTTEWIEQGRLHGVMDSPLSARGKQEAKLAAEALAGQCFDAFYTSPLGRARETAAIIDQAIGLEPVPMDGLGEMDFGWMEGWQWHSAKDTPAKRALRSAWVNFFIKLSGESPARLTQRVTASVREIIQRHPDQRVLAVTHMAVRSNILASLVENNPSAWAKYDTCPAGAFTEIELDPTGNASITRLIVDDHLKPIRSTP